MPDNTRTRLRKNRLPIRDGDTAEESRTRIAKRVIDFYANDLSKGGVDRELRLQRIAKFRMWTEGKTWPFDNASDIALPDMMEKSLRVQDTLHNAVMSQMPVVGAKADDEEDASKEDVVDDLIHHQVFSEQEGETFIANLIDAFVNDGVFTVFTPWVKEMREVNETRTYEGIPEEAEPGDYFRSILSRDKASFSATAQRSEWDYRLQSFNAEKPEQVAFFTTDDGSVEMVVKREAVVYDGPKLILKDYESVLHPPRVDNLQIPGPSNPGGAPHVILVDYPTIDEIKRLAKDKFYDLITDDQIESLENLHRDDSYSAEIRQRDDLAGVDDSGAGIKGAESQKTLTRLLCFDTFDIDGDGIDEDVIFWVIREGSGMLLKAALLTDMYPAAPPRRPFAEASFIPVRGRRAGISLLEQMEGLHDAIKSFFDITADAGVLANVPFFFYRASGGLKPDIIRLWPGEGYPLPNPREDVYFPQLPNQAQAFGINMITILTGMEEKLTLVGDIQSGRIPAGASSALRTIGGMAMVNAQAEERPERILRRLFTGLSQVWSNVHSMNRHFLPDDKKFRIIGLRRKNQDPYTSIAKRTELGGSMQFQFKANVLNTSKQALQGSLMQLFQVYVNDLFFQLGIVYEGSIYRMARDLGDAFGQDADKYLNEPQPGAGKRPIFAEEAISIMLDGQFPDGSPAESGGAMEHMQKLMEFSQSEQFNSFFATDSAKTELFKVYGEQIRQMVAAEQQRQKMAQAAQQFQQQQQQQQGAQPTGRPPESPPQQAQQQLLGGGEGELLPGGGQNIQ